MICPRLPSERVAGELGTHGFDSWAWGLETTGGNSYNSSTGKVSFGADKLWQMAYCAWKNRRGVLKSYESMGFIKRTLSMFELESEVLKQSET